MVSCFVHGRIGIVSFAEFPFMKVLLKIVILGG